MTPVPPTLPPETPIVRSSRATDAGPTTTLPPPTSTSVPLPTIQILEPPATAEVLVITAQVALVAAPTQPPPQPTAVTARLQNAPPPTTAPSVAAAAPTAVPPAEAPPSAGDAAAAEQYTIDLINQRRAQAGLGPLARNETLMAIARGRVADMVARGYTGHDDPATGVALGPAQMLAAGFSNPVGENWFGSIKGPPAIADVAMGWFMTDEPHYRNILSPTYVSVGVGIAFNGRQWLLVQDFAGP